MGAHHKRLDGGVAVLQILDRNLNLSEIEAATLEVLPIVGHVGSIHDDPEGTVLVQPGPECPEAVRLLFPRLRNLRDPFRESRPLIRLQIDHLIPTAPNAFSTFLPLWSSEVAGA